MLCLHLACCRVPRKAVAEGLSSAGFLAPGCASTAYGCVQSEPASGRWLAVFPSLSHSPFQIDKQILYKNNTKLLLLVTLREIIEIYSTAHMCKCLLMMSQSFGFLLKYI